MVALKYRKDCPPAPTAAAFPEIVHVIEEDVEERPSDKRCDYYGCRDNHLRYSHSMVLGGLELMS
jgi:hypothetical protein